SLHPLRRREDEVPDVLVETPIRLAKMPRAVVRSRDHGQAVHRLFDLVSERRRVGRFLVATEDAAEQSHRGPFRALPPLNNWRFNTTGAGTLLTAPGTVLLGVAHDYGHWTCAGAGCQLAE